jgi:tRNA 2-thiouridine synthesizing protein A
MKGENKTPLDERADVLDLRGLKCPLPALMTRRALLRSPPGSLVAVIADDPLAGVDIPHLCHHEGFEVLSVETQGIVSHFALRRSAPPTSSA